jgi:hypothetical protein
VPSTRRYGFRAIAQLRSSAPELATQRPAVVVRRQPRQLGDQSGALCRSGRPPGRLVAAEPTQGLQHGLVASPAPWCSTHSDPDEGRAVAGELRREGARNGGLADARLAGDEDVLPRPAAGFFELCLEPPQHGLAFHEPDRDRRWRPDLLHRCGRWRETQRRDRSHEPVPPAMSRLDEAGRPGLIPQHLAQLPHADLEDGVDDRRVRPHGVEECLLRHQRAAVHHQDAEDLDAFGLRRRRGRCRARVARSPRRAGHDGSSIDVERLPPIDLLGVVVRLGRGSGPILPERKFATANGRSPCLPRMTLPGKRAAR